MMKKAEIPLHHFPVTQGMETGAVYLTPGSWGQFITLLLEASATIDRRRDARQADQSEQTPLRLETRQAQERADSKTPDLRQEDRAA